MSGRVGVVTHCLNCGDDLSKKQIDEETIPHFCKYCIRILNETGQLPTGLLDQMRLDGSLAE